MMAVFKLVLAIISLTLCKFFMNSKLFFRLLNASNYHRLPHVFFPPVCSSRIKRQCSANYTPNKAFKISLTTNEKRKFNAIPVNPFCIGLKVWQPGSNLDLFALQKFWLKPSLPHMVFIESFFQCLTFDGNFQE